MKKMSQQHTLSFTRPARVACGMFLVLACVRAGLAQQVGSTPAASQSTAAPEPVRSLATAPALVAAHPASVGEAQEEQQAPKPKKGGEGIRVHGHWEITVKNADGTVAEHRDFENSLTTSGAQNYGSQLLAALLSGNASPGGPGLALLQNVPADPTAACFGYIPYNCTIFVTPSSPLQTGPVLPAIVQSGLTAVANFTPTASLVLGGTFEQLPTGTTKYTAVEAFFPVCVGVDAYYVNQFLFSKTSGFGLGNWGPNQCNSSYYSSAPSVNGNYQNILFVPLTFTLITSGGVAAPLTLAASQTIAINFTLTFS